MRPNWLDRWVLAGRDPYRPVYLLRVVRLQYAFAISLLVVLAFSGFLWWSAQQRAHADCRASNQRTALSTKVLDQLGAASSADGDRNEAAVWRQYAALSHQASLPRC